MRTLNIILIEDCESYREVVAIGLNREPTFHVCGEFNTTDAALEQIKETSPPNLILLDLNLPGKNGLKAIPDFRKHAPESHILILTESDKEADTLEALSAGASGYLLKESSMKEIIYGVHTVFRGGASLDPKMARYLLENLQERDQVANDKFFSSRELEVIELVAKGLLQKEIAAQIHLSPKTVDFHLGQIYRKLGVKNAPAAVAKAYENGTLPLRK